MSDFEIDFEWPVAKYEFRPGTAEDIDSWRHIWSRGRLNPAGRDYYTDSTVKEILDMLSDRIPEAELPFRWGRIVAVSEPRDRRPTAEAMERVVTTLVECKETPFHIVALTVARAVGLVMGIEGVDYVFGWLALAHHLRAMFEGKGFFEGEEYKWPHPRAQRQGEVGIYLVPGKHNRPILALRPDDLQAALILYAARMKATGTTFNVCEHCKTPFLSGGVRGRNKRGDARFCSDECRWRYHNESRRKAR